MTLPNYAILPMTRSGLDTAADWAAAEGWNPGLNDAACYWEADPDGFFMGFLDEKPVSSISLVKYGAGFGFLGFYIVAPEYRGRGYGLALWQHAMASAAGRNIGLDGVVDQQDNYKKSGFKLAFRNIRFQGKTGAPDGKKQEKSGGTPVPLDQMPGDELLAYDRPFFPEDRSRFLKKWVSQPGALGFGLMTGSTLEGWGLVRACRSGHKIGPLFADTPEGAARLFEALAGAVPPGSDIYLDVPEPNAKALELAGAYHMSPCFETARMYTGPFPDLPLDRIYGITSFEVG